MPHGMSSNIHHLLSVPFCQQRVPATGVEVMPSTEQALLVGLLSWGLLVSCHWEMLASTLISWSLSNRNNLELAGTLGGSRRLCPQERGQVGEGLAK